MMEGQVLINNRHPAYLKAVKERVDGYHAVFCVAWSLSGFLKEGRSPQQFINQFLAAWGREDSTTQRLFHV